MALGGIVPVIMLFAAVGKLMDYPGFVGSVESFDLVNPAWREAATVLVPAAEMAVFALLLCGRRAGANLLALALIGMFSAVVVWHWMNNERPDCSCIGLWSQYLSFNDTVRFWTIRNGALMAVAVASLLLWRLERSARHALADE